MHLNVSAGQTEHAAGLHGTQSSGTANLHWLRGWMPPCTSVLPSVLLLTVWLTRPAVCLRLPCLLVCRSPSPAAQPVTCTAARKLRALLQRCTKQGHTTLFVCEGTGRHAVSLAPLWPNGSIAVTLQHPNRRHPRMMAAAPWVIHHGFLIGHALGLQGRAAAWAGRWRWQRQCAAPAMAG
jgi:hypothetical protein